MTRRAGESPRNGLETILVVDDDPLVLNMCSACLSNAGYQVVAATDGLQAIEMCRQIAYRIDLALIDAVMPMMSGPELEEALRGLGIRILIMSGYPESQIFERLGRSVNYDRFLAKPFTSSALVKAVKKSLGE